MRRLVSCLLLLIAGVPVGCANLSKPYPVKESYALHVPPVPPAPLKSPGVLRVERVRVSAPFDARSFVYRRGADRYETDYYHEFVAEPESLLTGQTARVLAEAGVFDSVVEPDGRADARLRLEVRVTDLYADYRDTSHPAAVVRAHVLLLADEVVATEVRGDWTWQESVEMEKADPAHVAPALATAYSKALARLVPLLAGAAAGPPPAPPR